jgi:hypothetical protein
LVILTRFLMQRHLWLKGSWPGLATVLLMAALDAAAADPSRGLWIGEVTLNRVNQVGVDAYVQAGVTPPGPGDTTPTASAAHFRLMLHVDSNGQVRLLKSVALFSKTNSSGATISLVTDPALYPQFTGLAKRISAITFDFGDLAAYRAITNVAGAAASAAATAAGSPGATQSSIANAAALASSLAVSNAAAVSSMVSSNYHSFIISSAFTGPAANAAAAAATAAYQAATNGGATPQFVADQASSAALIALTSAFTSGDTLTRNEVEVNGSLAPGSSASTTFFLGASHPTNPFMHRRHPDHTQGYDLIRTVQLLTDPAPTNSVSGGYGVNRLTGVYREEVHGLHKPLGPSRDIGLRTEGLFTLTRVTLVDTLNQ